jgi:hypothetical protein
MLQPDRQKPVKVEKDVDKGGQVLEQYSGSLAALSEDYALFTYAPMFLYGGMTFNPVQEWLNVHDRQRVVRILQLSKPVISLSYPGPNKLDSIVWAVEKEYWSRLAIHIGALALVDRARQLYIRPICQELQVLDVGGALSGPLTFTLYTFGVDSNK